MHNQETENAAAVLSSLYNRTATIDIKSSESLYKARGKNKTATPLRREEEEVSPRKTVSSSVTTHLQTFHTPIKLGNQPLSPKNRFVAMVKKSSQPLVEDEISCTSHHQKLNQAASQKNYHNQSATANKIKIYIAPPDNEVQQL